MATTTPCCFGCKPPPPLPAGPVADADVEGVGLDGDEEWGGWVGLTAADEPWNPLARTRTPTRTAATTTSRRRAASFTTRPPSRPHLPARVGAQTSKPSRRA